MITTLDRVRHILTLDEGDESIANALIPMVEQDYLHIRNKPWDVGNVLTINSPCTTSGNLTLTYNGTDFTVPVLAGDNAFVVARKIAFRIDQIIQKLVTTSGDSVTFWGYATLALAAGGTGVTATTTGIDVIYPHGAELTAIKMIEHHMTGAKAGVTSERLGDYSVSYTPDYPQAITSRITKYVSFT
jgi:hypothetical protein